MIGLASVSSALQLDSNNLFSTKCLVAMGQEHVLCFTETVQELESPVMAYGSVKSLFYALAKMIGKMDPSNSGVSFGGS